MSFGLEIVVAVLAGMLLTAIGGGLTLWRDVSVLSGTVNRVEQFVLKMLDDHEQRIRDIEKGPR